MISKKTLAFIESIIQKTELGQINWIVARRDEFKFSTPTASVYVSQALDIDHEIRVTSFAVHDENGTIVDHFDYNVDYRTPETSPIEALYNYARRNAYKADDIMDSIIRDLELNFEVGNI